MMGYIGKLTTLLGAGGGERPFKFSLLKWCKNRVPLNITDDEKSLISHWVRLSLNEYGEFDRKMTLAEYDNFQKRVRHIETWDDFKKFRESSGKGSFAEYASFRQKVEKMSFAEYEAFAGRKVSLGKMNIEGYETFRESVQTMNSIEYEDLKDDVKKMKMAPEPEEFKKQEQFKKRVRAMVCGEKHEDVTKGLETSLPSEKEKKARMSCGCVGKWGSCGCVPKSCGCVAKSCGCVPKRGLWENDLKHGVQEMNVAEYENFKRRVSVMACSDYEALTEGVGRMNFFDEEDLGKVSFADGYEVFQEKVQKMDLPEYNALRKRFGEMKLVEDVKHLLENMVCDEFEIEEFQKSVADMPEPAFEAFREGVQKMNLASNYADLKKSCNAMDSMDLAGYEDFKKMSLVAFQGPELESDKFKQFKERLLKLKEGDSHERTWKPDIKAELESDEVDASNGLEMMVAFNPNAFYDLDLAQQDGKVASEDDVSKHSLHGPCYLHPTVPIGFRRYAINFGPVGPHNKALHTEIALELRHVPKLMSWSKQKGCRFDLCAPLERLDLPKKHFLVCTGLLPSRSMDKYAWLEIEQKWVEFQHLQGFFKELVLRCLKHNLS